PGDADSRSVSSPEVELSRRFKDFMRRIFWDRFTQSLLPPPSPTPTPTPTPHSGSSGSSGSGSSAAGVAGKDVTDQGFMMSGGVCLRVGTKVHARYGSERGSYYAATVLAVGTGRGSGVEAGAGEGGVAAGGGGVLVDVKYDEDGIVERGIPVSRLRKAGDPPDFGPLLSLLGEVREELISLTPNNPTLVHEVTAVLSQERLAGMLDQKALNAHQVQ
ncbi:unnamed protein product, partial [Laminaria digitata]